MKNELEDQSNRLKSISTELEKALKHSQIAADHFLNSEVPRACAHTLALEGHLIVISEVLKEIAKTHRIKASV